MVAICKEACKMQHDGEFKYYKDMAIYVKTQLDKKIGGSWHIIVGKLQLHRKLTCDSIRYQLWIVCYVRVTMHVSLLARTDWLPCFQARMNDNREVFSSRRGLLQPEHLAHRRKASVSSRVVDVHIR